MNKGIRNIDCDENMPHNLNCEQELLSAILNDEKILPEIINEIDIQDFYIKAHRIIYAAVCSLFADGKDLSISQIIEAIGQNEMKNIGGVSYLTELMINSMPITPKHHIKILKEKSFRRKVIIEFGKVDESEIEKILKASDKLSKRNNMFTDCTPGQNLYSIRAKSKSIKHIEGLDVIIIDHLNLMDIPRRETRDFAIGEVTRGLKILSKELDVCILLICQLSRAVEQRNNKRPMLSDLRESGNIEQDADMVMFLYRDEYYNKYSEEKGIIESRKILCKVGNHKWIFK